MPQLPCSPPLPLLRRSLGAFLFLVSLLFVPIAALSQEAALPSETGETAAPPWGKLSRVPIFLEVSRNLLASIPIPSPQTRWSLPETDAARVPAIFTDAGLSPSDVATLTRAEAMVRTDGWMHFFPSNELVISLPRESRAKLYGELAKYDINEFQESPVLILTDTVEEWYRSSRLPAERVATISQLAYRRGTVWAFSDVALLVSQARDEADLQEFFKSLTRTRTYLVRMSIGPDTDATLLKSYWRPTGTSFRRKDIEPIIESLKETGTLVDLDLAHVLPPLARKFLYTYPGPEHAAQGVMPDCHWTSLNYFNYDPHGYLLDSRLATSKVLAEYQEVSAPFNYGDILFFLDDATGDAFHSCIFLAEDLVFTKNGRNQMAPWIISTLDDTSRIYLSSRKGHIQGYRPRTSAPTQ